MRRTSITFEPTYLEFQSVDDRSVVLHVQNAEVSEFVSQLFIVT